MAICRECAQEMTTAGSCREWAVPVGQEVLPTLRFGQERVFVVGVEDFDDDDEDELRDELGDGLGDELEDRGGGWLLQGPHFGVLPRARPVPVPLPVPERCGDCGVRPRGWHHPGCDIAECPKCGWQQFSCPCWDGERVVHPGESTAGG